MYVPASSPTPLEKCLTEARHSPFWHACDLHDAGPGIGGYLANSVYGWACHDGLVGNGEVTGSERLIGWLTLLVGTYDPTLHLRIYTDSCILDNTCYTYVCSYYAVQDLRSYTTIHTYNI